MEVGNDRTQFTQINSINYEQGFKISFWGKLDKGQG
jgi:hypothetical protein